MSSAVHRRRRLYATGRHFQAMGENWVAAKAPRVLTLRPFPNKRHGHGGSVRPSSTRSGLRKRRWTSGVGCRSLGLGQYEAAFRDNEIDGDVLPKLTVEDLKDLGVAVVGHRRKIMSAIEALNAPSAAPAEAAHAPAAPTACPRPTPPSAASSP